MENAIRLIDKRIEHYTKDAERGMGYINHTIRQYERYFIKDLKKIKREMLREHKKQLTLKL